jgi:DNA-binding HxlR family transcriptional regulator
MALFDLLGRRGTLRIVWELRDEALTFRALAERCGKMSPTLLNTRLGELRETGLVDLERARGYALTQHGEELLAALAPVAAWSARWGRALAAAGEKGETRAR